MTRGVIGNTSDFGSEESRFEPWRVNKNPAFAGFFFGPKWPEVYAEVFFVVIWGHDKLPGKSHRYALVGQIKSHAKADLFYLSKPGKSLNN